MPKEPLARPKDIYVATRAVPAPSMWQEPAGRVAAEAICLPENLAPRYVQYFRDLLCA